MLPILSKLDTVDHFRCPSLRGTMECSTDEQKNARNTDVFYVETIFDLVSSQESLVSNLIRQKTQLAAQAALLKKHIARLEGLTS